MKYMVISYKIHRHMIGPVLINPCLGLVRPKKPMLKKKKRKRKIAVAGIQYTLQTVYNVLFLRTVNLVCSA